MEISLSRRMASLPPYLFAELDRIKEAMRKEGKKIYDLTIGDPDIPTVKEVVSEMSSAIYDPRYHRYPSYAGRKEFRGAVADWYRRRFGVSLDPDREVIALIGSKEGIAHIPLVLCDPGDIVLYTDPGYPVYRETPRLFGIETYPVPLKEENDFLPDLSSIPPSVLKKSRLLFLNYPNNPTGAMAGKEFFQEVVRFGEKYGIVIVHDNAYSEIYDEEPPPSFLSVEGGKEVGVEFHSLSKTFCMTGWRIGMLVGNEKVVQGLLRLKTHIDSGVFEAIQIAGARALSLSEALSRAVREKYAERRKKILPFLQEGGFSPFPSRATFYVWCRVPDGKKSVEFCQELLKNTGVAVTPGVGFGEYGERYFRISLTVSDEDLEKAGILLKEYSRR